MASILKVNEIQHTGGTSALTIDSSGRIGGMNNPSFKAYMNGDQTGFNNSSTGDVVVIYNDVTSNDGHNIGSHYDIATGKFTAPIDGVYFFTGSVYSAATTYSQIWFVKNGSRAPGTDFAGVASNFQTVSAILKLDANDTVGVHPYMSSGTSTITDNDQHSYFTGCLIFGI